MPWSQPEPSRRGVVDRRSRGPPERRSLGVVEVALQVGRVAELAELRRAAAEKQPDGPVHHQASAAADARHQRQVVGARREPGREAAEPDPDHRGHGPIAPHVHEHAERPVVELAHARRARSRRPRCRPPPCPGASRAAAVGGDGDFGALAGSGIGRGVAHRPDVVEARHAQLRVGLDPPVRVQRQAELAHDRRRPHSRRPALVRVGTVSPLDSVTVRRPRVHPRVRLHLDPARAQLAVGERGQRRRDLGHDPAPPPRRGSSACRRAATRG